MPGNTGTSWEDSEMFRNTEIHRMADRARENYAAEQGQPSQASLHTIAYILALGELRAWRIADRLERIAQALEASLRGETITMWQVLDLLQKWAHDWDRARLQPPQGKRIEIDIIEVSYSRSTDQWKGLMYSDTTKEVFDLVFRIDEDFHLQMLSVERAKE